MRINMLKLVSNQLRHVLPPVLLLPVFLLIAYKIAVMVNPSNSDFFTFWLSGYLTSQGQNPYDSQTWIAGHHQFQATWIPNATFIYPIQVGMLFAVFGLLPPLQAYIAWNTLLQIMLVISVMVIMKMNSGQWLKHYYLPVIACVAIFRPTVVSILNGQISAVLLLLVALIMNFWEKGKWKSGAALLAFLAIKPNLGVPIILLLTVYLIVRRKLSALAVAICSGLLLLLLGWMQSPTWLIDFWNAGNLKLSQTFGYAPNVWGLSTHLCNFDMKCTVGIGAVVSSVFLAAFMLLILRKPTAISPSFVVGLAVVIMLLVTPYCWPYDQVLLIAPITVLMMKLAKHDFPYLPVIMIFLAIDIAAWALLGVAVTTNTDYLSAIIPFLVFSLIIWYAHSFKPGSVSATYSNSYSKA